MTGEYNHGSETDEPQKSGPAIQPEVLTDQTSKRSPTAAAWWLQTVMPCYKPLAATQLPGGAIIIHKRGQTKPTPKGWGTDLKLPCGRCIGCYIDRTRQWTTRCLHESQIHSNNCALTLTYSDDSNYSAEFSAKDWCRQHQDMLTNQKSARELSTPPPNGLEGPNIGGMDNSRSNIRERIELSKKDHQRFLKKLRGRVGPVRFYMCGEYGDKLLRPHYHYLIFGYDFPDKEYFKTSLSGTKLYRSKLLEEVWTEGHAWIGELDERTCAYVAAYVMKKRRGEEAEKHYRRTDEAGNDYWVTPEFNYMSRNPGIGKDWWDKYHRDITTQDKVWIHDRARKPPRYYDKLLERVNPGLYALTKRERLERAAEKEVDSPARLYDKEQVAIAKTNLKKREL